MRLTEVIQKLEQRAETKERISRGNMVSSRGEELEARAAAREIRFIVSKLKQVTEV